MITYFAPHYRNLPQSTNEAPTMKFRKKPVVIEAFCWTGGPDQAEDPVWVCEAVKDGRLSFEPYGDGRAGTRPVIKTLEGVMTADVGDWIICGVRGEIYPCAPDIFDMTYERAQKDARKGMPPCGECHLHAGETCDICGARRPAKAEVLEAFVRSIVAGKLDLHGADARSALLTIQKRAAMALAKSA